MNIYKVVIVKRGDDPDRTAQVVDSKICLTKEAARAQKQEWIGPNGIWSECDVDCSIEVLDEFLANKIAQEITNRMDRDLRGVTLRKLKDWVFDAWAEYPLDREQRESILSSVLSDYIIKCAVRGLVPKTGYCRED